MTTVHIIEGIEIHCCPRGAVIWMSDWGRWPKLKAAGHLRTEDGGPGTFGHTDIFVVEAS